MIIKYGSSKTKYGPGVDIELTGDEIAGAISAYLVAHDIHISGPRTITVNGDLCDFGRVYVDPSGFIISEGVKFDGRGDNTMNLESKIETQENEIANLRGLLEQWKTINQELAVESPKYPNVWIRSGQLNELVRDTNEVLK
jgi:hypothetical protein